MTILEDLLRWERDLFLFINNWQSPLLDSVAWLYSDWFVWTPFFVAFILVLAFRKPVRVWLPAVASVILMTLVGLLVSDVLLKPGAARFRPAYHPDFMDNVVYLFNYKGEGLYGFISGHATFSFAFAVFTTLLFRYKPYGVTVFVWAFAITCSRVYLGVHFVTDVLAGAIAGALIGLGAFCLYRWYINKYTPPGVSNGGVALYPRRRKMCITACLACYALILVVFGRQIVAAMIQCGWIGG